MGVECRVSREKRRHFVLSSLDTAYIKSEIAKWKKVIEASGAKVD